MLVFVAFSLWKHKTTITISHDFRVFSEVLGHTRGVSVVNLCARTRTKVNPSRISSCYSLLEKLFSVTKKRQSQLTLKKHAYLHYRPINSATNNPSRMLSAPRRQVISPFWKTAQEWIMWYWLDTLPLCSRSIEQSSG